MGCDSGFHLGRWFQDAPTVLWGRRQPVSFVWDPVIKGDWEPTMYESACTALAPCMARWGGGGVGKEG